MSVAMANLLRCLFPSSILVSLLIGAPQSAFAQARPSDGARSTVGGVVSLPDAMLAYVASGAVGACGENCSEWMAAEGTIYWDSHKRIIAVLDRLDGRKRPVVLNVRGPSNFNVAISIGRILRDRRIDAAVGQTLVDQCKGISDTDCTAMKRAGGSLNASLSTIKTCDIACVLGLVGGVRRTVPEATAVVIHGTEIRHRLGLNVSDERREGLHVRFSEQIRLYLTQMGVDSEFADMIDANYGTSRSTELSRADLIRLRIVTAR